MSHKAGEEFARLFNSFIDDGLKEDDWFVVLDCHI